MFQNNSNKNYVQLHERCFTDNPTNNNLYYRESETHARITKVQEHLRDNIGSAPLLYTTVNHPLCYCEEHEMRTIGAQYVSYALLCVL